MEYNIGGEYLTYGGWMATIITQPEGGVFYATHPNASYPVLHHTFDGSAHSVLVVHDPPAGRPEHHHPADIVILDGE